MNILFVYNAESGKLNSILDIAHKAISPATYQCSLCSLTHDTLNEKSEWTRFKASSTNHLEFLHKNEFEAKFKTKYVYPVILDNTGEMKVLFSKADLNKFNSVAELIAGIEQCVN